MRTAPRLNIYIAAGVFISTCAYGQILQSRPELCGNKGYVAVPTGLVAKDGKLLLTAGSSRDFEIDILSGSTVHQVCPLSSDRMLIFVQASQGGSYEVFIINTRTGVTFERFRTFNPSVSPNGRWLIYQVFYAHPPDPSDEYILYDLAKSPEENTMPGRKRNWEDIRGRTVYPAVVDGKPFHNVGLPPSQRHSRASGDFSWSADSKAVAFADRMVTGTSLVLIDVRHPIPTARTFQLKGRPFAIVSMDLQSRFLIITYKFDYFSIAPPLKTMTVQLDDFKPAPFEPHPEIVPMEAIRVYSNQSVK